jgi:hypothetical protein
MPLAYVPLFAIIGRQKKGTDRREPASVQTGLSR